MLAEFGITGARRAIGPDPTEEIMLLTPDDYQRTDETAAALAVMEVLPHTKV